MSYNISLEIDGPTAMWTRPDTGDAPVSYPAPTYGAVKGIFESILRLKNAEVRPTKVEICSPVVFHAYTTNYGGPLRKSGLLKSGDSFQLIATVLVNVCYRLHAEAVHDPRGGPPGQYDGINGGHAYQEIFTRRLDRGQNHRVPCLGWSEFLPDYVGPPRAGTAVCTGVNLTIPGMLKTCFPDGQHTAFRPEFRQQKIRCGVLVYA